MARRPRRDGSALERSTDPSRLSAYLEDAAHVPGGHATELVLPRSEADVAAALSSSATVLPIGAQSSLTGGATPRGDVLLSTARFRGCTLLVDGSVRVGAAVTLADLDQFLRAHDRFYPPGPTWQGATIGGTIATNAAGAATFKYGTTRAWVDALTVVLASGDVLDIRRGQTRAHADGYVEVVLAEQVVRVPIPRYTMPSVPKLSAGYFAAPSMDLLDLFVGSEGTLGIVTEATLRTRHRRPALCLVFATFPVRHSALLCVEAVRRDAVQTWSAPDAQGLDVAAIEHMDARCLELLREDGVDKRLGISLNRDAALALLITVELPPGTTAADAYGAFAADGRHSALAGLQRLAELLAQFGAHDDTQVAAPGDTAAAERLLALREAVPVGVNRRIADAKRDVDPRIEKTAADTIVPVEHVEAMLDRYDDELRQRGLDGAVWGHISDGNVHPNVIPRSFQDVVSGRDAVRAFGLEAIRLGGAPLAEHGVGRNPTKMQLLEVLYGADGIEQMRQVKRALDPTGKLAPGVIFGAAPR